MNNLPLVLSVSLSILIVCVFGSSLQAETKSADVIVYGSTPGGFCAAIAAAREGVSVILLEPTSHVGGVNTGGLSFSDSNQTVRSTVMGLFDEWHRRIEADYKARGVQLPYDVSVKDNAKWTYEPHVATRVTMAMLQQAGVEVLSGHVLASVKMDGATIKQLFTNQGAFEAKTFVDATYEGDLMAAANVSWTIGREGKAEFGESLAGKRFPKGKMKIDGFDADGKLLPLVTTDKPGEEAAGDGLVMVYSFRLCLTAEADNRVPMPQPANYDPARFEAIRRYIASGGRSYGIDLYPLPGNKFDGNNSIGGQFSLGLVGACNGWSETDQAGRDKIFEEHKQYTLEFYHFLTTDPAVPDDVRAKYARLGLCKDEFAETGHFPPQLYVREGRRMQGMFVVSQKDILESPEKDDPIAVSSFPIDSHDCQRVAFADSTVADEGTIFPVRIPGRPHGYAYHIPYRAIVPKPGECDNLLVPVAMSCTHVGISSIRVEPTWMIIGQSAGIAAALAAKEGKGVQSLSYPKLRERLLAQGQVLELPELAELPKQSVTGSIASKSLPGIVLDDTAAKLEGSWATSSNFKPNIDGSYLHDGAQGDGTMTATFEFAVPKSGKYEIRMAYSAHPTRAKKVPVVIANGASTFELVVDQTAALPSGEAFRTIGMVTLEAGKTSKIVISNQETDGFVILDAIQLIPVN
ncbi:xanthan lyase [Blastopirellula marina]|uniref:Xanthan lyase n=1 Tax=Blastopirellula marina TaxID=124 RepID=A0A2S8F7G1_9BACT|nr:MULTISPECIES: FAD-dependent oxidoreductase [Pirellulaceae]PQO28101.1 xanthan lyase [Blastopirellula marina]RCS48527.1 FAD-dependent oxidoreductase [Bremerella cremea]